MVIPDFIKEFNNNLLKSISKEILILRYVEDENIIEFRKEVCTKNAGVCFDDKIKMCKICGCFMQSKWESLVHENLKKGFRKEITHCPCGKWGDKETANIYLKMDGFEQLL